MEGNRWTKPDCESRPTVAWPWNQVASSHSTLWASLHAMAGAFEVPWSGFPSPSRCLPPLASQALISAGWATAPLQPRELPHQLPCSSTPWPRHRQARSHSARQGTSWPAFYSRRAGPSRRSTCCFRLRSMGHLELEADYKGHLTRVHSVAPGLYPTSLTLGGSKCSACWGHRACVTGSGSGACKGTPRCSAGPTASGFSIVGGSWCNVLLRAWHWRAMPDWLGTKRPPWELRNGHRDTVTFAVRSRSGQSKASVNQARMCGSSIRPRRVFSIPRKDWWSTATLAASCSRSRTGNPASRCLRTRAPAGWQVAVLRVRS